MEMTLEFHPSFTIAEMDALLAALDRPAAEQAEVLARNSFDLGVCAEGIGKVVPVEAVPDPAPGEAIRLLRDDRKKLDPARLMQIESGAPLTPDELQLWRDLRLEEIGLDEEATEWPYLRYCVTYDTTGREIYVVSQVTDWDTCRQTFELAGLFATAREAEYYCPGGYWIA